MTLCGHPWSEATPDGRLFQLVCRLAVGHDGRHRDGEYTAAQVESNVFHIMGGRKPLPPKGKWHYTEEHVRDDAAVFLTAEEAGALVALLDGRIDGAFPSGGLIAYDPTVVALCKILAGSGKIHRIPGNLR
jgi:hypothetical protein